MQISSLVTASLLSAVCCWTAMLHAQDAPAARPVGLYVAVTGNDAWSGTLAQPNDGKTDGPLATLSKARDEVRRLKAAGPLGAGITVWIREGTYELPEPLAFAPDCAGEANAPVVFAAYNNETVVLSGGRRITGWTVANGRWEAKLPDVAAGTWDFARLFVNNEERRRPCLPREGYWFVRALLPSSSEAKGNSFDRFRCGTGEILPTWSNPQDVELHFFHCWSTSRLRLKSVEGREVTTTGPTFRKLDRGTRYLAENVKEALSQPGEWYLDRPTGTLTYIPLPGEDPETTPVYAPCLKTILELKGDPKPGMWVQYLQFKGLTFAHSNWTTPPNGHCISQAEFSMPGAVTAQAARDCTFTGCTFTHTSSYALEFGQACKRIRVETCDFTDLGAGGIKIGEGMTHKDDELVTSHITVSDCRLAHGGRMFPAAIGIWVGRSHDITLEHNDIFDFYYSGVSVGWTWGYEPGPSRDNTIAYNHIHWMPQGVLGDQAGIYTLGMQPGGVIRGNYIHDQFGEPWACGIYLDEGTSFMLVEDNLINRVTTHAFHCNYGKENIARNNIFSCGMGGHIGRCRGEEHVTYTVEQNIIYWEEGPLLAGHPWEKGHYQFDRNLYWNPNEPVFKLYKWTWEEWQAMGQDKNSIIADPLFVDPKNGDFTLKPGSPAEKIGFKPFDVSKAGLLTKRGEPFKLAPRAWPPAPKGKVELPPELVKQDFEAQAPGSKCSYATTNEDEKAGKARVTDETGASGKHSLKFEDAPGQKYFYNPHVFYQPGFKTGLAHGSFDLRWETGAVISHEWRDYATKEKEFLTGPNLSVAADGSLSSGGTKLLTLPTGQWVHVEFYCQLGDQADGKYDLSIKLPDGQVSNHPGLTFTTGFKSLDWCGFVAMKEDAAVFYIDNLVLEPDAKR